MASSDMSAHEMPIEELLARLDHRPPGTTPAYLAKLDIGIFPSTLYTKEDLRQLNAVDHTFHFLRWIHRNNGSDVALIKWKDQPGLHVLKIHKNEKKFDSEKAAYARLEQLRLHSTGHVLHCSGYCIVTPESFFRCDVPTCTGNEDAISRFIGRFDRDPTLPIRAESAHGKATYSWKNPSDVRMADLRVDFRSPEVKDSWYWTLDNTQFGKDGQWLPEAKDLKLHRHALVLEYLPDAKRMDSSFITRKLALEALAGARDIQKALILHGDQSKQNLLVGKNGRVVWVDFDRSEVCDTMDDELLYLFKRDLVQVHRMIKDMLRDREKLKGNH